MRKPALIAATFLIAASSYTHGQAVSEPATLDISSDEQISKVLAQSDRALQMNRHCLLSEGTITSFDVSKNLKTDNEGQAMAEQIIEKIRSDHDYFHGGMDVMLLTALDDVSRNAALTSGSLLNDALQAILIDEPGSRKGLQQIKESQACTESSAFVYTVSESLNDLVIKELKAQNQVSAERDVLLTKIVACSK